MHSAEDHAHLISKPTSPASVHAPKTPSLRHNSATHVGLGAIAPEDGPPLPGIFSACTTPAASRVTSARVCPALRLLSAEPRHKHNTVSAVGSRPRAQSARRTVPSWACTDQLQTLAGEEATAPLQRLHRPWTSTQRQRALSGWAAAEAEVRPSTAPVATPRLSVGLNRFARPVAPHTPGTCLPERHAAALLAEGSHVAERSSNALSTRGSAAELQATDRARRSCRAGSHAPETIWRDTTPEQVIHTACGAARDAPQSADPQRRDEAALLLGTSKDQASAAAAAVWPDNAVRALPPALPASEEFVQSTQLIMTV